MKKNILLVFVTLFSLNAMAQTRSRYINAPGDQGNIQFYDQGTGTNIITFTSGGVIISNLTTAGSLAIPAGSVGSAEIANYAITNIDIATNGVNSANILDGTIANVDINVNAAIAGNKLDLTNGTGRIHSNARAVFVGPNTTDVAIDFGQATNGQLVTFVPPFFSTPKITFGFAASPGVATNIWHTGANPTNFTLNTVPGVVVDWIAAGSR